VSAPLAGLRVVEACDGVPVAWCGRQFAMWGAEVVVAGARLRGSAALRTTPRYVREYLSFNKQLAPAATYDELCRSADVLLTDRRDIDVDQLASDNPRLVVLHWSDFGRTGPYAGYQATDLVLQALTGYMTFNGKRRREPLKAPAHVIEYACGTTAFIGVLAALIDRKHSGRGQNVDVAAMEALASLVQYTRTEYFGEPARRSAGVGPPMLPCADGWLFANYLAPDSRGPAFAVVGVDDPGPDVHWRELLAMLAERSRAWPKAKLFEALARRGAVVGAVHDPGELRTDPHLASLGFFRDGVPGPPARFSATPGLTPEQPRAFEGWPARDGDGGTGQADVRPPLAGLLVLDVTHAWQGPYATMLMADMGADVIKVESPVRPDLWRLYPTEPPPCARPGADPRNTNHFFNSVNRNKRSLTLDLATERGRELFLGLAARADLVIDNFSPRVMDRFGLGDEALRAVNPEIVTVSCSGYGKTGPYGDFKANGASIEAMSGFVSLFGYADDDPFTMGEYQMDPICGLHMAAWALAALYAGRGQAVDGSMLEIAASYIGEEIAFSDGLDPHPRGNASREMHPHGVYRCAGEDAWVAIACRDEADRRALWDVLGGDTEDAIARWTAERTKVEAMRILQEAGVPAGAVQTTQEALDDAHLAGWFVSVHHPDLGTHRYNGFPWTFSRGTTAVNLPPPRLGEHAAEVLRDELGLAPSEVDEFVETGAGGISLEA
jgi:crotonobetainyl-CoA:carnitine CoA-transferase CaiB-like acyl-CoA transferase